MVGDLDIAPATARGSMFVSRGRIIYIEAEKALYIAKRSQSVRRYAVTEITQAAKHAPGVGRYFAKLAGGQEITFYRDGCPSCGFTLGRVAKAELIAKAVPA